MTIKTYGKKLKKNFCGRFDLSIPEQFSISFPRKFAKQKTSLRKKILIFIKARHLPFLNEIYKKIQGFDYNIIIIEAEFVDSTRQSVRQNF